MNTKAIVPLSICAVLLVLLTGCQPNAQTSSQAPTSGPGPLVPGAGAAGKTNLTLWTIWNTEPRQGALAEIVKAFQAANPDITVTVSAQEPDAYKTGIRVALGGSQPPDIFFVWSGEKMLHNFVRGGNVADLTADLDADSRRWRSQLIPSSLASYTYDGKTYGVPYLLQCTFLFYNKQLFAEKGWRVPATWEDLVKLCGKIKPSGLTPLALGNLQKWPASHFPCVLVQRADREVGGGAAVRPARPRQVRRPRLAQVPRDVQATGGHRCLQQGAQRRRSRDGSHPVL